MKKMKLHFVFLLSILFFSGCKDIKYDYTLSNLTEYPATIFDESNDYYTLEPFQNLTIQHTNSARFTLVDNPYPIYLENWFTLTEIKYLKTYNIKVFNRTQNTYTLNINNDPFKQEYILLPGEYIIEVYIEYPSLQLLFNNIQCDNFIYQDNKLYIF